MLFIALIQAPTFSQRHTKTHTDSNKWHSERDCHRSTTTQLQNADMSISSHHSKTFLQCCHGKHMVSSSRNLLSDHIYFLQVIFFLLLSYTLTVQLIVTQGFRMQNGSLFPLTVLVLCFHPGCVVILVAPLGFGQKGPALYGLLGV